MLEDKGQSTDIDHVIDACTEKEVAEMVQESLC